MMQVKRRKGWRMSCNIGEVTERLENELCYNYELCSFSYLSVTSPSQLILQPFRRFTSYVTAHSPTLPLLHLRHSSFSNPSFASPTSQALHLRHLTSCPCNSVKCTGVKFVNCQQEQNTSTGHKAAVNWKRYLALIMYVPSQQGNYSTFTCKNL